MRNLGRLVVSALSVPLLAAARAQAQLVVEGLPLPGCDGAFAGPDPVDSPSGAAQRVLATMRMADLDGARRVLAVSWAAARRREWTTTDLGWLTPALYWYLRASRDDGFAAGLAAEVDGPLRHMPPVDVRGTFALEALLAHALLCRGGIVSARGRHDAAGEWIELGVARWREVERLTWQPGLGHFRPRCTGDDIVLPAPADPAALIPAAAGMLLASDDRMERNLMSCSRRACDGSAPERAAFHDATARAAALAAAAQLADRPLRDAAWRAMVEALAHDAPAGESAARCLDAALFAVTGVRLATGVAVDEGWLRLRPWLPPGHEHVRLTHMIAEGATFDLDLSIRTGPSHDDELDDPASPPPSGPRLRVRIDLVSAATGSLRVILQGGGVQIVTTMAPGDRFERSLTIDDP
ncbi:MAG: hypothetical protein JNK78_04560 [Planctomycetes bacterium]|nr:hypothetical protein [Planctomycetota bacterium]